MTLLLAALAIGSDDALADVSLSSTMPQSGDTNVAAEGARITAPDTPFTFTLPPDVADIRSLSIEATIRDGDTGAGDHEENDLTLALDGLDTRVPLNGFRNNQPDTQTNTGRPPLRRRVALLKRLQDGTVAATITDRDNDGGRLTVPAEFAATLTITFDTGPDTQITNGPKKKAKRKKAKFRFTSTEPGSTFSCSLDGKPFTSCSSPHKVKVKRGRKHSFRVRATDPLGNVDPTPASYTWKVRKRKKG